jgi:plastocyanin
MIKLFLIAGFSAALAASAWAGDLVVTVTTPDGKPLPDAVVTLPAPAGATKPTFAWKQEVAQQNKTFVPFVLIAPVGGVVEFPNLDKFRHHVYSFSKGNKFELELYGREEKRTVKFKTEGTAALGCNIHDEMVAFIRVVATPFAAKSDATGHAELKEAPNGPVQVSVWHPYAKAKGQTVTANVTLNAGAPVQLNVVVDIAAPHGH